MDFHWTHKKVILQVKPWGMRMSWEHPTLSELCPNLQNDFSHINTCIRFGSMNCSLTKLFMPLIGGCTSCL